MFTKITTVDKDHRFTSGDWEKLADLCCSANSGPAYQPTIIERDNSYVVYATPIGALQDILHCSVSV